MKRTIFIILTMTGIFSAIFNTSAWSVNNFLMTGPKAYLTYSTSVAAGAQLGMEECKHQFNWERWNCPESTLQLSTHNKRRRATRETSFVHAISSAGVMYTLTRNCSMGDFENCGCDASRNGRAGGKGWIWGGCTDNVEFGEKISKHFVDAMETGKDIRALINLHNNEAGRMAVKTTMKRTCKCHGVSGSCSLETCWLQLAEFREVGHYLKARYDQAQKLELSKSGNREGNSAESRGPASQPFHTVPATELIFLEDSPNYCTRNLSLGLPGTAGRECLPSSRNGTQQRQKPNCKRLCRECGLGTEQKQTTVVTSCHCKFQWCCTVKCEQCKQVVTKHYCARREGPLNNARRRNRGQGR